MSYPFEPGSKTGGTSEKAAGEMRSRAETLREMAYDELRLSDLTADEVAANIGESVLAIRPRLSELRVQNRIVDTGTRRYNVSGKSANVWRAVVKKADDVDFFQEMGL